jgi:hypothetical protein
VPSSLLALVATAEHFAATRVDGSELPAPGGEIEIVLAPSGTLDVDVVDPAGVPLRDVRVRVSAAAIGAGVGRFEPSDSGVGFGPSDARGRLRIESLPCGVELRVAPWSSRSARERETTTIAGTGRGLVQLVVASTGALTGVVRPLPETGGRVEARFRSRALASSSSSRVQPDGRFDLERLPAGPGTLDIAVIRLGSRATTSTGIERDVEVRPGETTDLGLLELAAARAHRQGLSWKGSGDDFVDLCFLREGGLPGRRSTTTAAWA